MNRYPRAIKGTRNFITSPVPPDKSADRAWVREQSMEKLAASNEQASGGK
jgi:hypothetical protein